MSTTDASPIALTPGGSVSVPLKLEYDSVDPTTISVSIAASTATEYPGLSGLTFAETVSMPATYVDEPAQGPKGSSRLPGIGSSPINHFDRSVVENQVELLTKGANANRL